MDNTKPDSTKRCLTFAHVRAKIEAAIQRAGSQTKYAEKVGVSQPMISQILRGERVGGEEVLAKLGFRLVEHYEEIRR